MASHIDYIVIRGVTEGDVVRELCALYGVKKTRTTPYHPEGNAQAERFSLTNSG